MRALLAVGSTLGLVGLASCHKELYRASDGGQEAENVVTDKHYEDHPERLCTGNRSQRSQEDSVASETRVCEQQKQLGTGQRTCRDRSKASSKTMYGRRVHILRSKHQRPALNPGVDADGSHQAHEQEAAGRHA